MVRSLLFHRSLSLTDASAKMILDLLEVNMNIESIELGKTGISEQFQTKIDQKLKRNVRY